MDPLLLNSHTKGRQPWGPGGKQWEFSSPRLGDRCKQRHLHAELHYSSKERPSWTGAMQNKREQGPFVCCFLLSSYKKRDGLRQSLQTGSGLWLFLKWVQAPNRSGTVKKCVAFFHIMIFTTITNIFHHSQLWVSQTLMSSSHQDRTGSTSRCAKKAWSLWDNGMSGCFSAFLSSL